MLVCICVEFAEICCCVTVSGCVSMKIRDGITIDLSKSPPSETR